MSFRYEPPLPERTVTVMPGNRAPRLMDKTVNHVTKGWIPVNPRTLETVKEKLNRGAYRDNSRELMADIKDDPGLVVHCLRKVSQLSDGPAKSGNPIDLLKQLEEEKLATLLSVNASDASMHRFQDANKHQALQLQRTLFSTQSAEAMAPQASVDPELAFTSTFLHQLGYALISWNYPDIYNRTIVAHRSKGTDIDEEFKKLLGLTPLQLASIVADQLHITGSAKRSLSSTMGNNDDKDIATLQSICTLADVYARSKDLNSFPEAAELLASHQSELNALLPRAVRTKLDEHVAASLRRNEGVKAFAELPIVKTPETTTTESAGHKAFLSNSYANRCPQEVKKSFEQIYDLVNDQQGAISALRELTNAVIPTLGFSCGCLYMRDSRTGVLEPALRFGDRRLESYTLGNTPWHRAIAASVDTVLPYKAVGYGIHDYPAHYICGGLGNRQYYGVLYLELARAAEEDPTYPALLYFQAVRQLINDCLGATTKTLR